MHLAVVIVATRRPPEVPREKVKERDRQADVEIDLIAPAPADEDDHPPTPSATATTTAKQVDRARETTAPAAVAAAAPAPAAKESVVDDVLEVEGPKAEGWAFNPRMDMGVGVIPDIGLRASGAALVQRNGNAAVENTEARGASPPSHGGSKSGGLIEGLDARDRAVGLSRSGPLVTAVEDAVREGNSPVEGRALFVVTVDRERGVIVSLANADKEVNAWSGLAALIKAKAAAKAVRLPPNAQGIIAQIEVSADVTWPDGQKRRDTDKPVTAEVKGVTVSEDGRAISTPSAAVSIHGKVCSATLRTPGITVGGGYIVIHDPITGGCSLENIGARAQRVVHGRIVGEQRF